jgi:hypothetical protein
MTTHEPEKPLLARRLRRWQDVREFTNDTAAAALNIPLRTYTNALYGEHQPRGVGLSLIERFLTAEENRLKLPPLEPTTHTQTNN